MIHMVSVLARTGQYIWIIRVRFLHRIGKNIHTSMADNPQGMSHLEDGRQDNIGPDIVIHQKKECVDKMGEWCQKHHATSGLTEKVTRSLVTEREAENQVIEFVKKNVRGWTTHYKPLLAGNLVYVDLLFVKKCMPELASLFCHVLVDVSSINALCMRWFTKEHRNALRKEKKHRAMDDIKESIAELKYYKDAIFKPSELDT